ncbi:MAG: aminodeoxychorismate/anthranilate synthase component II [Leptospirales bacterium]
MKVLIIDNYDSFTFNLYQYVGEILEDLPAGGSVEVFRNDEITIDEIRSKNYDRIIISPGPGNPMDKAYFGVCSDVITELGKETALLGVCLGLQGIAYCFGAKIIKAKVPMHGKVSEVKHDSKGIFKNLPEAIEVMRYHSLIVDPATLPDTLEITSTVLFNNSGSNSNIEGEIMGLRHKQFPIEGIQFHPESFGTEGGKKMLENFIVNNG